MLNVVMCVADTMSNSNYFYTIHVIQYNKYNAEPKIPPQFSPTYKMYRCIRQSFLDYLVYKSADLHKTPPVENKINAGHFFYHYLRRQPHFLPTTDKFLSSPVSR